MKIAVRQATLEDTAAIVALHRARVPVWQRLNAQGRVEDVPYERLSLYERWLHAGVNGGGSAQGAWMSVETGAIFLNHLLLGAGLPLVAVDTEQAEAQLIGYCEAYINNEPEPFGVHLHIASLLIAPMPASGDVNSAGADSKNADSDHALLITRALLEAVIARARRLRCQYVTFNRGDHRLLAVLESLSLSAGDSEDEAAGETGIADAAAGELVQSLQHVQRFSLPARTGQVFYKVTEHLDANPLLISGWAMPIGRTTSPRHLWETLWTPIWNTLPDLRARRTHRLKLASGGQDAYLFVQQQLYNPRAADIYVWTVKPALPPPILTGLRDWAHREGYRALSLVVASENARLFSAEADAEAFTATTYGIPLAATPPG